MIKGETALLVFVLSVGAMSCRSANEINGFPRPELVLKTVRKDKGADPRKYSEYYAGALFFHGKEPSPEGKELLRRAEAAGLADPYTPKVASKGSAGGENGKDTLVYYEFSDEQLARMKQTPLDSKKFVSYLEDKWTVERLKTFCVATNLWPVGCQNLVPMYQVFAGPLHANQKHGFESVFVYVNQDDGVYPPGGGGKTRYGGMAGLDFHRWMYSLNIKRGTNYWVIIESLPNDFMGTPATSK